MEAFKLNITIDKDWLEATWTKEVTTINEVEKEVEVDGEVIKEIVKAESIITEQIHCESFSGHKEHIMHLMQKVDEHKIILTDEQKILIQKVQDSFIYPTNEEIETEKRKQFEIQFRYDRDVLLKKVDIAINKAEDTGLDSNKLRTYRQALRDATISWVMPESIL